jgi:transposase
MKRAMEIQEIVRTYEEIGTIKGTARKLKISKGTVKKYLRRYEEEQRGQRDRISPENEIRVFEKIGCKAYDQQITELLKANANYPKKQRLTAKKIYHVLVRSGQKVSYSTVQRRVRIHKQQHQPREVYIQQEHPAGKTVEYDWGEVTLTIGGVEQVYQIGVFAVNHSLHYYSRLYQRQTLLEVIDIHKRFLEKLGGVPEEIVYDNMKTVVIDVKKKKLHSVFIDFSTHYGFRIRLCNPSKPNEKGTVENGVGYVRREAFSLRKDFATIEEANEYLSRECDQINSELPQTRRETREKALEKERESFRPLPQGEWDNYQTEIRHINKYSMIAVDGHTYSVPDTYCGGVIQIRKRTDQIELWEDKGLLAIHRIPAEKGKSSLLVEHFLLTLQKKPGALANSTAFRACSNILQLVFDHYYSTDPKGFLQILELMPEYKEEQFLSVLKELQQKGIRPTVDLLRNLLNQNTQPPSTPLSEYTLNVPVQHESLKEYDLLMGGNGQ